LANSVTVLSGQIYKYSFTNAYSDPYRKNDQTLESTALAEAFNSVVNMPNNVIVIVG